jgi:hypothetical protein
MAAAPMACSATPFPSIVQVLFDFQKVKFA